MTKSTADLVNYDLVMRTLSLILAFEDVGMSSFDEEIRDHAGTVMTFARRELTDDVVDALLRGSFEDEGETTT